MTAFSLWLLQVSLADLSAFRSVRSWPFSRDVFQWSTLGAVLGGANDLMVVPAPPQTVVLVILSLS